MCGGCSPPAGGGAFHVEVEFRHAPVRLLGRSAAAVCDVVEVAGRGAQSVGVGGQGAARFGRGLVGRAARAGVEEGPFLQGTHEGAHAFLQGLVPVALGGVRLGGRAVLGGAAGAVAEQGGGGRGPSAGRSEAPPQGGQDGPDGEDDDQQAECAAGGGGRRAVEQVADPVPEGVQGALEEAGVVLVVQVPGQLAAGRLPGGVAGHGDRRPVARAGRHRRRAAARPRQGGQSPAGGAGQGRRGAVGEAGQRRRGQAARVRRGECSPRRAHRISSPSWRRGRGSRSPGGPRRGPGRGRGPRGGCAGRCRGAR